MFFPWKQTFPGNCWVIRESRKLKIRVDRETVLSETYPKYRDYETNVLWGPSGLRCPQNNTQNQGPVFLRQALFSRPKSNNDVMMMWHSCDSGVNVSKINPGDHEVSSLSRGKKSQPGERSKNSNVCANPLQAIALASILFDLLRGP